MSLLGLPFSVSALECDESCDEAAANRVRTLAVRKALAVAQEMPDGCWVLGADTLVEKDGTIYGKPSDEREAFAMLSSLSGAWHNVHTGVALVGPRGATHTCVETARVRFVGMSRRDILSYIATGEPMDKAGAYGIQGRAGAFIDRIEGDYYAVVGLPLCRVREMLNEAGVCDALD